MRIGTGTIDFCGLGKVVYGVDFILGAILDFVGLVVNSIGLDSTIVDVW